MDIHPSSVDLNAWVENPPYRKHLPSEKPKRESQSNPSDLCGFLPLCEILFP